MEYHWILLSVFLHLTFHPGKTFALDAPLYARNLLLITSRPSRNDCRYAASSFQPSKTKIIHIVVKLIATLRPHDAFLHTFLCSGRRCSGSCEKLPIRQPEVTETWAGKWISRLMMWMRVRCFNNECFIQRTGRYLRGGEKVIKERRGSRMMDDDGFDRAVPYGNLQVVAVFLDVEPHITVIMEI